MAIHSEQSLRASAQSAGVSKFKARSPLNQESPSQWLCRPTFTLYFRARSSSRGTIGFSQDVVRTLVPRRPAPAKARSRWSSGTSLRSKFAQYALTVIPASASFFRAALKSASVCLRGCKCPCQSSTLLMPIDTMEAIIWSRVWSRKV